MPWPANNTDRLIRLVNDLLVMEKLQADSLEFDFVELDLSNLIENAIDINELLAKEHNVTFKFTKALDGAVVYGDADRLTQVISNLLSNAAKFSPANEIVDVSVERTATSLRINVSDVGDGIPNAFRSKVFERFSQADSSDTRRQGGTGLGLNISKEIVEKHGGIIGFESEEGRGARFYFELPDRKAVPSKAGQALNNDMAAVPGELVKRGKVLVLEDDPDVATLLAIMLKDNGYDADIARSAGEAKAMLLEANYAAVTVDIMLPDQDGISLIQELRAQERTRNVATIVVSAKASEARSEILTASMGIVDWLDKPIDQKRLIDALHKAAVMASSSSKPRVLHVEDDWDLCRIMTAMIGNSMDYVCAHTLIDARKFLESEKFDLAILDMGLPDGNGLELLDVLKCSKNDAMPAIIFSSDSVNKETESQVAALVKSNHSNEDLLELVGRLVKSTG